MTQVVGLKTSWQPMASIPLAVKSKEVIQSFLMLSLQPTGKPTSRRKQSRWRSPAVWLRSGTLVPGVSYGISPIRYRFTVNHCTRPDRI